MHVNPCNAICLGILSGRQDTEFSIRYFVPLRITGLKEKRADKQKRNSDYGPKANHPVMERPVRLPEPKGLIRRPKNRLLAMVRNRFQPF